MCRGRNLTSPKQFRSKEISTANVVDGMVASTEILLSTGADKPSLCIVPESTTHVGDSECASDEYTFQVFIGGPECVVGHNACKDSRGFAADPRFCNHHRVGAAH